MGGQLAAQAYIFHKNNGGAPEDPVIYEGLRNAYAILDSNKHSIIGGAQLEGRTLTELQGQIVSADINGNLYNEDFNNANLYQLGQIKYTSPANALFFSPAGDFLVTGHDNFNVCIWNTKSITGAKNTAISDYKELKGHKGVIRAAIFSNDGNNLITAGKDSSVIVWNLQEQKTVLERRIKTSAAVKALAYIGEEMLVTAQEDGKIVLWNSATGDEKVLYKQGGAKPLCLAYNKSKNSLIAGFSDGSLKLFDLKNINAVKYSDFKAHSTAIELITFNKDFSLLATAAADKSIKLYNTNSFFENNRDFNCFNFFK